MKIDRRINWIVEYTGSQLKQHMTATMAQYTTVSACEKYIRNYFETAGSNTSARFMVCRYNIKSGTIPKPVLEYWYDVESGNIMMEECLKELI